MQMCPRPATVGSDGFDFVVASLERMTGGEVFVPRLPAVDIGTVAEAVGGGITRVPVRPGEKRHELLVSANEVAEDMGGWFVVGRGSTPGPFSSLLAERLDVDGFRRLAGLDVLDSGQHAKERPQATTAPGA